MWPIQICGVLNSIYFKSLSNTQYFHLTEIRTKIGRSFNLWLAAKEAASHDEKQKKTFKDGDKVILIEENSAKENVVIIKFDGDKCTMSTLDGRMVINLMNSGIIK